MPDVLTTTASGQLFIESSSSLVSGTTTARIAKKIILDQIIASERNQNKISLIYKETLREMIKVFGELFYLNEEQQIVEIKCMHGSAERTIAKLKQESNIILPFVTVTQSISEDDRKRRKTDYTLLHHKWWDEVKQRAYRVVSVAPRAVNIMYSVNVWAKYNSDLDQITEQIRMKFYPSLDVGTRYSTLNQAFLTQEIDKSALDLGDKEDRLLRKSFDIQVQTYLPTSKYLVTSTGEIEKMVTEADITKKIV